MKKEIIKEAATVEEALAAAAAELGVDVAALQHEVVQQPQKKVLGLFGGQPAIVKAWTETAEKSEKKAKAPKKSEKKAEKKAEKLAASAADFTEAAARAKDYLAGVLGGMGAPDAEIEVSTTETGIVLQLDGERLGFVIGRRGDTLDALQYLTSLVANRGHEGYCRVTIDIGNYRERREESLSGMATKHAARAAKTGRKFSLEAMNPYERRIVHTAVQKVEGATSWSVGKEPNRHVIIGPSDDNPMKDAPQGGRDGGNRRNRRGNRGGNGNRVDAPKREKRSDPYTIPYKPREVRAFVSRQNPLPDADGVTPPEKTYSSTENSDIKLYGRIDI